MIELSKKSLQEIEGGLSISGTLLNSFSKIIDTIMDVGRSLGSAIRRINDNSICPLE